MDEDTKSIIETCERLGSSLPSYEDKAALAVFVKAMEPPHHVNWLTVNRLGKAAEERPDLVEGSEAAAPAEAPAPAAPAEPTEPAEAPAPAEPTEPAEAPAPVEAAPDNFGEILGANLHRIIFEVLNSEGVMETKTLAAFNPTTLRIVVA